jgi:hypothetical protein
MRAVLTLRCAASGPLDIFGRYVTHWTEIKGPGEVCE